MEVSAGQLEEFQSAQELLGIISREARDNKFARAAREIAALDIQPPPLTGPPHRTILMGRGFIDILI